MTAQQASAKIPLAAGMILPRAMLRTAISVIPGRARHRRPASVNGNSRTAPARDCMPFMCASLRCGQRPRARSIASTMQGSWILLLLINPFSPIFITSPMDGYTSENIYSVEMVANTLSSPTARRMKPPRSPICLSERMRCDSYSRRAILQLR